MAINKFVLQGRLTKEPEVRHTQSGKEVASFTLAWSEKHGDSENKLFMPCVAWGNQATFVSTWFHKGQECLVEGQLRTRQWQDKEGNKRETTELIADKVHFCGPKADGAKPKPQQFEELDDTDSDLPF